MSDADARAAAAEARTRKVQDDADERCQKVSSNADARVEAVEQRLRKIQDDADKRCRTGTSGADARVVATEERMRKIQDDGNQRCQKAALDADARIKTAEKARAQIEVRCVAQAEVERSKWLALGLAAGGKEMQVCVFKGKRSVTGFFVRTHQQAMLVVGLYQGAVKFLDGDTKDLTQ